MADRKHIAEFVHSERRRSGLTQQELAERAGVSVGTVSRIERGRVYAEFGTVVALAEAMGVSRAEALRWLGEDTGYHEPSKRPAELSPSARAALDILNRLAPEEQVRLLHVMKAFVDSADPEGSAKMFRDAAKA